MVVYRPDEPARIRAAAQHAVAVASASEGAAAEVAAADPGEGMRGPFADVVRARLRERTTDLDRIGPGLRAMAGRLEDQAAVVAARIAAIEAASAEAASLCARWPELTYLTRGLDGLDTSWLDVLPVVRAEAALLRARDAASAASASSGASGPGTP